MTSFGLHLQHTNLFTVDNYGKHWTRAKEISRPYV